MYTGPKITRDGLVFGYDADDRSTRFYKGEPTVNLTPSPEKNARFDVNNDWGTFQSSQYNSNTFFSIGTIDNVTNNIVTLSSIDRVIYTYDVLRPETSGGGLTANTDYYIKKLTSSSFTLHTYNNSQDGSQGYINSSTGTWKVHDTIANDERISINSTNFPTSWKGQAHLPNSLCVKELKYSGGPNNNSSYMRIHATRLELNGTQGMAYNVRPSINLNEEVTVSFWARSNVENKSIRYQAYFGSGYTIQFFDFTPTLEWKRYTYTYTAPNTFDIYQYFLINTPPSLPYHLDLADIQVEVGKGHVTPFVIGTRSSTEGLLDLTGNTTIDLSNVSFDSTAHPTFDGTDDKIDLGDNFDLNDHFTDGGNFSIEAVIYMRESPSLRGGIFCNQKYSTETDPGGFGLAIPSNNTYVLMLTNSNPTPYQGLAGIPFNQDQYHHICFTFDSSSGKVVSYSNGSEYTSVTNSSYSWNIPTDSTRTRIGANTQGGWDNYINMDIPVLKVYNKTLTSTEIQQNYRAYKNRFGI